MDQELNFSLSYELLMQKTEDRRRNQEMRPSPGRLPLRPGAEQGLRPSPVLVYPRDERVPGRAGYGAHRC